MSTQAERAIDMFQKLWNNPNICEFNSHLEILMLTAEEYYNAMCLERSNRQKTNFRLIKLMLSNNYDLRDSINTIPQIFIDCCYENCLEILETLIDKYSFLKHVIMKGLLFAAKNNHLDILKLLHRCYVFDENDFGYFTILAISDNNLKAAKIFEEYWVNYDDVITPDLMLRKCTYEFLESYNDMYQYLEDKKNCLKQSNIYNNDDIIKNLLKKYRFEPEDIFITYLFALKRNKIDIMNLINSNYEVPNSIKNFNLF